MNTSITAEQIIDQIDAARVALGFPMLTAEQNIVLPLDLAGRKPDKAWFDTLVATLGLQLLVVTPLTKVYVIEPYVKAIGFVDNPSGTFSRLQTMTIEEYRSRRDGGAR